MDQLADRLLMASSFLNNFLTRCTVLKSLKLRQDIKGMLHQGLEVKELNDVPNFKPAVSEMFS